MVYEIALNYQLKCKFCIIFTRKDDYNVFFKLKFIPFWSSNCAVNTYSQNSLGFQLALVFAYATSVVDFIQFVFAVTVMVGVVSDTEQQLIVRLLRLSGPHFMLQM
jgi:hypothetical protein